MRIFRMLFALLVLWRCSSPPGKKILVEEDYKRWQGDIALRMGQEIEDLALVRELMEIALINEDFPAALKHLRSLREKAPAEKIQLSLMEIAILRYTWQLDSCLGKIVDFNKANPGHSAGKILARQKELIEKSKALPPPLPVSPYGKKADRQFAYAQLMQAPEILYAQTVEKGIFSDIRSKQALPETTWKALGKFTPAIGPGADLDILHFPHGDRNGLQDFPPLPLVQNSSDGVLLIHADQTREKLDFLRSMNCGTPAFSPWLDFFLVSCRRGDHADLFLFTRTEGQWKETELKGGLNTHGDEISPRISADGRVLFFSSDGLPGYGAFDYYYSPVAYTGECGAKICRQIPEFGQPVNFGPRINTYHNEIFPLQISPLAKEIIFAAEGKETGLVGRVADTTGFPQIRETISYRFIGYSGTSAPEHGLRITPLKNEIRKGISAASGLQSDWIRLVSGAEYEVAFSINTGIELHFRIHAPTVAQNKGANFVLERFSFESSPEATTFRYDEDAARVTKTIQLEIEKMARILKENPEKHVLIEGHTDNLGGDAYNVTLSHQRAESIKKIFVATGLGPERITARGWGELRPLNKNATDDERAANRRVEILIVP